MSPVPEELRQAYLRTHYHVGGQAPFILHIDQHSPPLESLMEKSGCSCAAFITAWNPMSRQLDLDRNMNLQRRLEQDIALGGWKSLPGSGRGADGDWPPEPSFLVLGIPLETAKRLAGKYRQYAFVWCPETAVPELVWIPIPRVGNPAVYSMEDPGPEDGE